MSLSVFQLLGQSCDRVGIIADDARDVVTAIDVVDDHAVGGVFAVNMYKSVTAHISHTGTAEDLARRVSHRLFGVGGARANITGTHGDGRIAADIPFVATAIDVAANRYLTLSSQRKNQQQEYP